MFPTTNLSIVSGAIAERSLSQLAFRLLKLSLHVTSYTKIAASASLKYIEERVLNLSAPGMSQIYKGSFLFVPAKCTDLSFSVAPIVERRPPGIQPFTNLLKMAVFPTPVSPTITTLRMAKDVFRL